MSDHDKKIMIADAMLEYSQLVTDIAFRKEKLVKFLQLCRQLAQSTPGPQPPSDMVFACRDDSAFFRIQTGAWIALENSLSQAEVRELICERDAAEKRLSEAVARLRGMGVNLS